jgi:hypothetical protein
MATFFAAAQSFAGALNLLNDLDTMPSMGARLIIAMSSHQWGLIDTCMDNDASVEAEQMDADRRRVRLARRIQRAGWDQIAHRLSGVPESGPWPPPDEIVKPKLTINQWLLTVDVLEHWATIGDQVGHHDSAAQERELRELIISQLQAHGVPAP